MHRVEQFGHHSEGRVYLWRDPMAESAFWFEALDGSGCAWSTPLGFIGALGQEVAHLPRQERRHSPPSLIDSVEVVYKFIEKKQLDLHALDSKWIPGTAPNVPKTQPCVHACTGVKK